MTHITATANPYLEPVAPAYRSAWPGLAWSPVMAGVVTAIAAQLLFTVLGMAIGVSVSDAADGADAGAFGTMAGIWWLITGTVSLVIGGMVLGRLWNRGVGMALHLHAFTLWAVVALFGFLVIWSGAGLATNAASPMAAIVGPQDAPARTGALTTDAAAQNTVTNPTAETLEAAQSAARTASWWSVIGLLIGVAASVVGAAVGARQAAPETRPAPAM